MRRFRKLSESEMQQHEAIEKSIFKAEEHLRKGETKEAQIALFRSLTLLKLEYQKIRKGIRCK